MENVEQLKAAGESLDSETRRHGAAVAQMKDVFDHLNARIASVEQNTDIIEQLRSSVSAVETSVSHTEDAVARLQAQDPTAPLDRRLESIEHVLSDIMGRLEYSERNSATQTGSVEQTLRELASGFETTDRRNRDVINELQTALEHAAAKIAAVEEKVTAAPFAAETPTLQPAQPIFDAPVFPEHTPVHHQMTDFGAEDFQTPPFAAEAPHFEADMPHFGSEESPPPAFGDAFADPDSHFAAEAPPQSEPHGESFLAAARRSAQAAAAAKPDQPAPRASLGGFNWTLSGNRADGAEPQDKRRRVVLAGSVFGIAVAAALTGVVLTKGVSSPQPNPVPPAAITSPLSERPSLAPNPSTDEQAASPATSSPGSADESAANAPVAQQVTNSTPEASAPVASLKHQRAHAAVAQAITAQPAAVAAVPSAEPSPQIQKLASLANTGDSKSQLLLGLKYLEGSSVAVNESEGARWLSRAAQQGEPLAQYRLGTLYERGRGVPADARQASHWYELAAKQGNRKAMHNLAVAFAEGSGEPKDPVSAAMWFSRAANLGLADSQFNLAVLYERGMGVKQSLVDAYKWYLVAAAQGDAESKSRADALSTQLSDADRTAAQQAAAAFRPERMNSSANTAPVLG
jgi:localization factor PodJL